MKSPSPVSRDCAALAPLLTALFDGEANDAQITEARAHLLVCPVCSRSWLDWTQHRATLQSEPVMPPPPTLLWRVLIAYRIAAFARPARRRSRLPAISAAPLRGIEAPLPPRLSEHILARTTRKPNSHVLLTPMQGAPVASRGGWKTRASNFRRVSLFAAPALALWLLILGRADFNAFIPVDAPVGVPDQTIAVVTAPSADSALATPIAPAFVPVRVAEMAKLDAIKVDTAASVAPVRKAEASARPRNFRNVTSAPRVRQPIEVGRTVNSSRVAVAPQLVERAPVEVSRDRAGNSLNRAVALAIDAGQRDFARARFVASAPAFAPAFASRVPVARSVRNVAPTAPERSNRASGSTVRSAARVGAVAPTASLAVSTRSDLGSLTSPSASVRTLSAARLRPAIFSEEPARPRVTHASAGGRRLARLVPEESATPLRVSRPIGDAPTLREPVSTPIAARA